MEQLTGWMLLVLAFGTGVTLIVLKFAERRHRRNIELAVRLERIRAWNKAENDAWYKLLATKDDEIEMLNIKILVMTKQAERYKELLCVSEEARRKQVG